MEITGGAFLEPLEMHRSLLIFLVILSACNPGSKESLTKKMDDPHLFQDGGVLMLLPGTFVRSSVQEIDKRMNDLQLQEPLDGPSFIFRDTTNVRNTFYFTEASYLDVEAGKEEKMFSEFESVMIENSKKIGATCKALENDHFSLSNGDEVYKMLYEISLSGEKEYSTTYFIASKTRIVIVIVHNISDDGEATVRSMNIDPYFYVDPLPSN